MEATDLAVAANLATSPLGAPHTVPIGDYGFLSDGEVTALVSPGGSIDWMCLPRMDSPSLFRAIRGGHDGSFRVAPPAGLCGAIRGPHPGGFRVAPPDVAVPAARRYLPGTMVLETSWGTDTGWIIVRDALLLGPWRHEDELSRPQAHTPPDYEPEHILLRTIRCVKGEVQTVIECDPSPDYGRATGMRWSYTDKF